MYIYVVCVYTMYIYVVYVYTMYIYVVYVYLCSLCIRVQRAELYVVC